MQLNNNINDFEEEIIKFYNKLKLNQNNKLILSSLLSNSLTFSLIIYILSKQKKSSNDLYILTSFLKEKKNLISLLSKERTKFENILNKISINLKNFFENQNNFIFKVGEKGNLFYIILKGKVSVLVPKQLKIKMTYYNYINHLIILHNYDEKYLLEQTIKLNQKIYNINKNILHNIKTKKDVNLMNYENIEEYLNIINHNYSDINKSYDNEEEINLMGYFKIITLSEGSTFGEIALINENNKRTASIFCETNCNFGILSSNDYKNCIKSIQIKIKKDNINFVLSNKLFNQISFEKFYEVYWNYFIKGKIKKDEFLFKENDKRNFIYIIDYGEIKICKKMNKKDIEKTIYKIFNYKDNEHKNLSIKINNDNDDYNSNENENIIFISDNNNNSNNNNKIKSNDNIFLDDSKSECDYSNNNTESKDKKKIEIIINIIKKGDLLGLYTINNEHLFNAVCISNECSYFALDINLFKNIMKKHYNIQINFIELKKKRKKLILQRLYKIMETYKKTVYGEFRDKSFYINKEIKNIIGNCYKKKINNFLNNKKFILEKKKVFSLHNKNNNKKKYSILNNESDLKNKITAYNLYDKKINSRNSDIDIYKIKNDINSYNNSNSNNYYSNSNVHTQNNSSKNIKKLNNKIKSLINLKQINNNNLNIKNIITSYSNNNTYNNTTINNTSSNNIKTLYKKNKNISSKIINNIFISKVHKNKKINNKFIDFLVLDKIKNEKNIRPASEHFFRYNNLPLNYLSKAKPLRIKLKSFF